MLRFQRNEHQLKLEFVPSSTPGERIRMSKRHPLMSESHLREMDNDAWNRAAPGHTGSPRY